MSQGQDQPSDLSHFASKSQTSPVPVQRLPDIQGLDRLTHAYAADEEGNGYEDEYPEGGFQAWMVVVGAWCAMIPPMGLLNTIAVLQSWLSENELAGMAESKTGWIFSCYAFFITACGAQVGSCDFC